MPIHLIKQIEGRLVQLNPYPQSHHPHHHTVVLKEEEEEDFVVNVEQPNKIPKEDFVHHVANHTIIKSEQSSPWT